MDHSLYFPAGIAASDFNPFTREVAMPEVLPVTVQSSSTRPRASMKPGGVTRPVRRNLLELGLACGQGAVELEAQLHKADAARREADRAAGLGSPRLGENGPGGADGTAGTADRSGQAAAAPDPAAIAALARDIQDAGQKRDRLADEIADLDRQRSELQAKLMTLLGKRDLPTAPAPPAPPANAGLPIFQWSR